MALDASQIQEYIRSALAQQQLYAYWNAAGDTARAHLAMDVANWYQQQLGAPFVVPANDPTYVPAPKDPTRASVLAGRLPLDAGTPTAAGGSASAIGAGSAGAAVVENLALGPQANVVGSQALYDYCQANPDDPICYAGGSGDPGSSGFCSIFPDDPSCYSSYYGYPGDTPPGPTTIVNINTTTVVINQQGLTLGDVASRIKGALSSATAAVVGAIDAALRTALSGVQSALNAIGNELISIFSKLSKLAGYILKFLQTLLLNVLHGLVRAVQAIGHMLADVFRNGIMPALQALQKIRTRLIEIYEKVLRPVLIVIQDMRKVLGILGLFHFKFAQKLDAVLGDIQRKITAPLFYLLRYTNAVANFINLILTADLLLQKPLFLNSANTYLRDLIGLQINGMVKPVDPAAIAAAQLVAPVPTPAESSGGFNDFVQHGGGIFADLITQQTAQLDVYLTKGL